MITGRLLMVVTGLGLGGAERQLILLALGLRVRGWDVRVVSLTGRGPLALELDAAGIPVVSLGMTPGRPSLRALVALAREYRTFQPAVVHAHMVHANLAARLARLLAPVPRLLCTAHNTVEGGAFRGLWYRATDRLADVTTQVSRAGLARYVASGWISAARARYVPNGLPVDRFVATVARRETARTELGLGDGFTWVCIARLEPAKDHQTLFAAWSEYLAARPGGILLVVGQGGLEATLRAAARKCAPDGSIRFLGPRNDIPEILAAADGVVLASRWEGSPMALLEAGAAGLPVVATAVGGVPALLEHFQLHRAVEPGDPAALAAGMEAIASVETGARFAAGIGTAAAVRESYALETVLPQWERLYLAGNRPVAGSAE